MGSPRKHDLTAAHHLLYLALMGKDWRKGFTPPTNRVKLANGALWGWTLFRALNRLHARVYEQELLAPFGEIVTPHMLERIRTLLPMLNPYAYRPEQYAAGNLPFEAYHVPETDMVNASE